MPLDRLTSGSSQDVKNLDGSQPTLTILRRDHNFKYLPPPRLHRAEYLGVPYPFIASFAGPVTRRTVKDRWYLLLMAACTGVWILLLFHAFVHCILSLSFYGALDDANDLDAAILHPTDFFTVIQIVLVIMLLVIIFSMSYLFLFLYVPRTMVYVSLILWVLTAILVSLFIEAAIVANTTFNYSIFEAFRFLSVSFSIRAVILLVVVYFKIIYANALQIAIDFIILALQFIKEVRAAIVIPLVPCVIAVVFTSLNIGIIYLLMNTNENLIIDDLDHNCKCQNGYKNGSSCTVLEFQKNCHTDNHEQCSRMACTTLTEFSAPVILILIFLVFFSFWSFEVLFSVLMLVMDDIYAKYYFNQVATEHSTQVLKGSLFSILRYHSGTAACGALIMLFLQLPSFFVNRIDRIIHLRPYLLLRPIDNESAILTSNSSCALLNFTNHFRGTVFVFPALFGFDFHDSFDRNFKLIYRNSQHFYVPDMLIDTIFKAGKWTVLCITCIISCYVICDSDRVCFGSEGNSAYMLKYITVILLICVTTYAIISYCFCLISSAVYTVYICFLTETEMLSYKLPSEEARWEVNHNRRQQLFHCLHRLPPPSFTVNQN